MTRCLSCDGIIARTDSACYSCGERVPKRAKLRAATRPASLLSNVVFLASLGFAGYSFLSGQNISLAVSLSASGVLLFLKLVDFLRRSSNARHAKFLEPGLD